MQFIYFFYEITNDFRFFFVYKREEKKEEKNAKKFLKQSVGKLNAIAVVDKFINLFYIFFLFVS